MLIKKFVRYSKFRPWIKLKKGLYCLKFLIFLKNSNRSKSCHIFSAFFRIFLHLQGNIFFLLIIFFIDYIRLLDILYFYYLLLDVIRYNYYLVLKKEIKKYKEVIVKNNSL